MTVNTETKPHSRSKDPASILEHFATLADPRRDHGKIHMLDEIVFMAICAALCGADSWQEIAEYSESKSDWLKTFLTLPGGGTVARYVPPRLLLARPAGLPGVFLRLDDRADESAWLDFDPH